MRTLHAHRGRRKHDIVLYGASGFTGADLISATARAYQFCFDKEGPRPPSFGLLLNRPPSKGAFHISMHDLGDLVLHTLYVRGVQRDATTGADDAETVTVVISPGIDS